MKTILICAASLVLVVVLGFTFKTPTPQVWEYKIDIKCNEKRANEMGAQGWEMVSYGSYGPDSYMLSECAYKRVK